MPGKMEVQMFFVSFQNSDASAFTVPPNFKTKARAIAFARKNSPRFAVFHQNVCVHEE